MKFFHYLILLCSALDVQASSRAFLNTLRAIQKNNIHQALVGYATVSDVQQKTKLLFALVERFGDSVPVQKVCEAVQKMTSRDQALFRRMVRKYAPAFINPLTRALLPNLYRKGADLNRDWSEGTAKQLDDVRYLDQGKDITAYRALQIPGDYKVFDDPILEAKQYHNPYPADALPRPAEESGLSEWFLPYMSQLFRNQQFKDLYDANSLAEVAPFHTYIIPPIIHQIWVGPKSNERYERMRSTWIKNHPGWIYKLWTDEDVKKLKLINQRYYDSARSYAEKADILRYELLYLFGGIYADIDTESLVPLDILNHCYEFYTGLADNNDAFVNNAFIASVPRHPILREVIRSIPHRIRDHHFRLPVSTGPVCLSNAMLKIVPHLPKTSIVALPPLYLNGGMLRDWSGPDNPAPCTFMAHGYAASW